MVLPAVQEIKRMTDQEHHGAFESPFQAASCTGAVQWATTKDGTSASMPYLDAQGSFSTLCTRFGGCLVGQIRRFECLGRTVQIILPLSSINKFKCLRCVTKIR